MWTIDWQEEHLLHARTIAGPRYTPRLDVQLAIASSFDAVCRTEEYRRALRGLGTRLHEAAERTADINQRGGFRKNGHPLEDVLRSLAASLAAAASADSSTPIAFDDTRRLAEDGRRISLSLHSAIRGVSEGTQTGLDSRAQDTMLEYDRHRLIEVIELLDEVIAGTESVEARLANQGLMLLAGRAGVGKTHLLLAAAESRASRGLGTVVVLGEQFTTASPVGQVAKLAHMPGVADTAALLDELDRSGAERGSRSLLVIDALNESRPASVWKRELRALAHMVMARAHVALVVSIRDGFDGVVLSNWCRDRFVRVDHPGFRFNLWEAVTHFFAEYRMPLPEIPLVGAEFENPLFLKLFCEAFSGSRRPFRGHEGATHIFEQYVKNAERKIRREMGLSQSALSIWNHLLKPIASWMGDHVTGEIPATIARGIANGALPGRGAELLAAAERHWLVVKSPRYSRSGQVHRYVYRFPYQKFSDHLVVRYLLNTHFEPHKANDPSNAFKKGSPLWRTVRRPLSSGLLEALAAQVPERLNGSRELINLLPANERNDSRLVSAFLDSLMWRKPAAVDQAAFDLINEVVLKDSRFDDELIEALLSVAVSPGHPFNALSTHDFLLGFPMPDRDLFWSTSIHHHHGQGGAVDRLIDWAGRPAGKAELSPEAALLSAVALSWLFTSSNRFLRDRTTKALVSLCSERTDVLLPLVELFHDVDDPYVAERLYGALYGSLTRNPEADHLKTVADYLLAQVFESNPPTHILIRDYARGVVELALEQGLVSEIGASAARPPYGSSWPVIIATREELECSYGMGSPDPRAYGTIWHSVMSSLGDFAAYVIGTNAPHRMPWTRRRIGEPPGPARAERWTAFVADLDDTQAGLLASFDVARLSSVADLFRDTTEAEAEHSEAAAAGSFGGYHDVRKQFIGSLSPAQLTEYEALGRMNYDSQTDEPFDLEIAQCWIFKRAIDLGWSPERFGDFDRNIGRSDWGSHKAERVGKKYQWIAYHEFLGLVADNFVRRPGSDSGESDSYEGPWSPMARDIDPTSLAKGQDFVTRPFYPWPPSRYDAYQHAWSDDQWVKAAEDLPDLTGILRRVDGSSNPWLCLQTFLRWPALGHGRTEDERESTRLLWLLIQSFLVRSGDVSALVDWAAAQHLARGAVPETHDFYGVLLREFPWAPAYAAVIAAPDETRSGWVEHWTGEDTSPCGILLTTDGYMAEGGGLDCSLQGTVEISLPAKTIVEGMRLRHGSRDGEWIQGDDVVAADPSVDSDCPRALLFREKELKGYLAAGGLGLVWFVIGEKLVVPGAKVPGDGVRRLGIGGCFSLTDGGPTGALRFASSDDEVDDQSA